MQVQSLQFGFLPKSVKKPEMSLTSKDGIIVLAGREPHCKFVELRLTPSQAANLVDELAEFLKNM